MNPADSYIESRYDRRRVGTQSIDFGEDIFSEDFDWLATEPDIFDPGYDWTAPPGDFGQFGGWDAGLPDPTTGDLGTIPDPITTVGLDVENNDPWAFGDSPDWPDEAGSGESTRTRTSKGLGGFLDNVFNVLNRGSETAVRVRRVVGDADGGRTPPIVAPPSRGSRTGASAGSGGGIDMPPSREGDSGRGIIGGLNVPLVILGILFAFLFLRRR